MKKQELRRLIREEIQRLNESRISGKFNRKRIEKLFNRYGTMELFANGEYFFITPSMLDGDSLDADTTSVIAVDKDGETHEIDYKDIEFIEV